MAIVKSIYSVIGTSTDDAKSMIKAETDSLYLQTCLEFEKLKGKRRKTMITMLERRIRKLELGGASCE